MYKATYVSVNYCPSHSYSVVIPCVSKFHLVIEDIVSVIPQNPVQMGLKLDSLTNECSVHFVKAFWSLMEQDAVKVIATLANDVARPGEPSKCQQRI